MQEVEAREAAVGSQRRLLTEKEKLLRSAEQVLRERESDVLQERHRLAVAARATPSPAEALSASFVDAVGPALSSTLHQPVGLAGVVAVDSSGPLGPAPASDAAELSTTIKPSFTWTPSSELAGGTTSVSCPQAAATAPASLGAGAGSSQVWASYVDAVAWATAARRKAAHGNEDEGDDLLNAVRSRRKYLRQDRASLEADYKQWLQQAAGVSSGQVPAAVVDVGVVGVADESSVGLPTPALLNPRLAEARATLDLRARRLEEDMREAKAVERMLATWRDGGRGASSARAASAGASAGCGPWLGDQWNVSQADPDISGLGAVNGSDFDLSIVSGGRGSCNLLRRGGSGGVRREDGRRPLSARLGTGRRYPLSGSFDAPRTARDVLNSHAAWLREFEGQA